jgi:hypothetical protein
VTVTAAGAAGAVWFIGGWSFGLSLAVGAAVAQAVFACRVALLRCGRRDASSIDELVRAAGRSGSRSQLMSPATPLYGSEVEPLRAELRRARYLMTQA